MFFMTMSFSQRIFYMAHKTVLELVEDTSTKDMKYILNALPF